MIPQTPATGWELGKWDGISCHFSSTINTAFIGLKYNNKWIKWGITVHSLLLLLQWMGKKVQNLIASVWSDIIEENCCQKTN